MSSFQTLLSSVFGRSNVMERRVYNRRAFLQLPQPLRNNSVEDEFASLGRESTKVLLASLVSLIMFRFLRTNSPAARNISYGSVIETIPHDLPSEVPAVAASNVQEPLAAQAHQPVETPPILSPSAESTRVTTRNNIETYAREKASEFGLEEQRLVRAIQCESTFNPFARSKDNRYHGLVQYDTRTWNEALAFYKKYHHIPDAVWSLMQKDIYDPFFHIDVTVTFIKSVGYSRWPNC